MGANPWNRIPTRRNSPEAATGHDAGPMIPRYGTVVARFSCRPFGTLGQLGVLRSMGCPPMAKTCQRFAVASEAGQ